MKVNSFYAVCALFTVLFTSINAIASNEKSISVTSDSLKANQEVPANDPFITMVEAGYAHGYATFEDDYYGLDLVHAYIPNQHLSLGLGLGFHNYSWGFPGEIGSYKVFPIYIDFRYYPLNKRFTPYTVVKGGYSMILSKEVGVYVQTGVGFKYQYSKTHSLMLNLLYGIQNFQTYSKNAVWQERRSRDFKFIESVGFSLGWSF